jgi:uncharacterized protein
VPVRPRAYSSIGQSPRLITGLFLVRTQVGPLNLPPCQVFAVSIDNQVRLLRNLAAIDAVLLRLSAELALERGKMDARREKKAELSGRAQAIEGSIAEMERTRSELHHELRQVALQVDKAREKLTRCRNEKEANAATRELEELRRIHKEREKEIEKLVGLIGDARTDAGKATEARDTLLAELGETMDAAKTRVAELEEEVGQKSTARKDAIVGLEAPLLRRYEAVRSKRGSGLSEVVDGTCVACHIAVSPMLFQQIMRQQELFACPSCHRLLFCLPPGAADERRAKAEDGED